MKKNKFVCKNFFVVIVALNLIMHLASVGANDEFKQWMQNQSTGVMVEKKSFQEYKDKRDKDFTNFLKAQWKAVDIVKGKVRDEAPKPDVMPVVTPSVEPPTPVDKPVFIVVPKPEAIKTPVVAPLVVAPKGKSIRVDFFGKQVQFYYDEKLKQRLDANINKNSVSSYWSALSKTDYENLLKQLSAQKKSLQLNDWAYASLINKLATGINNSNRNESALLSWFLLAKSGYKARIAYNDSSIYLLVPSKQEMFEISYFTFDSVRYYAVEFDGNKQALGQVYTYDGEYPNTTKNFDMQVTSVVASSNKDEQRHLSFKFEGKTYNINVTYDSGRVKFFSTYPQLNLNMYFDSGVYKVTATPLQKQLASHMQNMSEQQAVNFLLRFVQTSLKYETDEQQFGEENYLFPEETLFYPYSDCEDRAILFAWLVQSLLKLQVVGLDFPGHVATAVNFNGPVKGDSVTYQGKHFVIADPTYINANVGMTMPKLKQYKPVVINY
ncbi:hypothetical protein MNBD_GAMMA06-570 [hydrothermal vent metagenome]|uniref:Transglutaminase-like domain-containing protein n=1 Tax=hydrothermal vent metagenome TaxID=652676 RepID=A0A3B0WUE1_9ZZZZ